MILLAAGGNLAGPSGPPEQAVPAALERLRAAGIAVAARSALYRTAAVGPGPQGDYYNLAARVETHLPPRPLLAVLHAIEADFGRARGATWGARTLDLDLLAWHGVVAGWRGKSPPTDRAPHSPVLPHPALHERPFVIRPLMDIAPGWHHPVLGLTVAQMWQRLARQRAGEVLERI